jgi:hypothetical protein
MAALDAADLLLANHMAPVETLRARPSRPAVAGCRPTNGLMESYARREQEFKKMI